MEQNLWIALVAVYLQADLYFFLSLASSLALSSMIGGLHVFFSSSLLRAVDIIYRPEPSVKGLQWVNMSKIYS